MGAVPYEYFFVKNAGDQWSPLQLEYKYNLLIVGAIHESPDKRCLFNKRRNIRNSPYNYFTKRLLFIKHLDVVGAVLYEYFLVKMRETNGLPYN